MIALALRGTPELEQSVPLRITLPDPETLVTLFKEQRALRIADVQAAGRADVLLQFRHRLFQDRHKIQTTGSQPPEAQDRVPLGIVVGDGEHFTKRNHPVSGAFDHLIGSLALAGVENFHLRRGFDRRFARRDFRAVEKNSDRGLK